MNKSLTLVKATYLRNIMIVALIVMVGVSVGGFYYAQDWFQKYATSSNINAVDPMTGARIEQGQNQIQNNDPDQQIATNKANSLVAPSLNYQSKIEQDLNKYASVTGVTITKTNTSSISPETLSGGIKLNTITITLGNPVAYTSLIKFLKTVETNIPKMQLTGINISQSANPKGSVAVEPLIVEFYTR